MDESNKACLQRKAHLTKEQRLPQYLKETEKVIRTVKSCKSNFKTVLANSRLRGSIHRKVYSLTVNVLKYYNYIQNIIDGIHLMEKESNLRREIATILIYEMIFGIKNLPGESKIISIIRAYENDVMKIHQDLQMSSIDNFGIKEIIIPRYVRVHTLVTTVPCVIKDLESLGFQQINYDSLSEEKYHELVKNLEQGYFLIDFHFKDILVFSCGENLTDLDLYKNGHIFLQDKASYIPVHVLNPEPGCAILDACAAPGMKTIHIASKMKNKGILIACERDKDRFETLKKMVQYGNVKICRVLCKDFKTIDPNDQAYSTVEYILLDPSCSGSGMVNRMDEVTDTENSKKKERLMKLAGFQVILLKHALRFPSVKRVVYSTCSINEEENEYVVHEALNSCYGAFKLVSVMPEWSDRGSESFEFGTLCLRTVPEKHLTNGFFVAMFERIYSDDYSKRLNFSKNRKHMISTNMLHDESNNHSNLKKHDFCEASPYHIKQNNEYSLPPKQFKRSNTSTLNELDQCPRYGEHSNLCTKEPVAKYFEYESNKPKKFKKKTKEEGENMINFQAETHKELPMYIHKGNLSDLHKENKLEFCESSLYHLKQNGESFSLNQSKKKNSAENAPDVLNQFPESSETSKQYEADRQIAKEVNFDCKSKKVKKHKSKTDKELIKFHSEANEELPEKLANIYSKSQECSILENISPSEVNEIVESNLKTKEKHKHKRHYSPEIIPESQISNLYVTTHKKKKKHVEETGFHFNELNSSLVNENNSLLPHNEYLDLSKEMNSLNNSSEHKKSKKHKKHKYSKSSKTVQDSERAFLFASIKNDSLRSKKHEISEADFERADETASHNNNNNNMIVTVENDHMIDNENKKHKNGKTVDFEGTSEAASINFKETAMSVSIQSEHIPNKKSKKHKSKKHDIENNGYIEKTDKAATYNADEVRISIEKNSAIKKKSKKCKAKKQEIENNEEFKRTDETSIHKTKQSTASIENYPTEKKESKKCKSKKHEIEVNEDCVTHKKSKKHKH